MCKICFITFTVADNGYVTHIVLNGDVSDTTAAKTTKEEYGSEAPDHVHAATMIDGEDVYLIKGLCLWFSSFSRKLYKILNT